MIINKRILLGVCGSIAAYKAAELVRLLRKAGAEVRVVMTESAQQFITPLTFQALSGQAVFCKLLDADQEQTMSHIHLARWADLLLIAPVTANMLAKLTYGLADDLLSTLYLAAECPVFLAPAMNQAMWSKSITQYNIQQLTQRGHFLINPEAGEQACGELGVGRMAEPLTIVDYLAHSQSTGILQNINIIITAGPTREPLDPVRFISNRSSGKMGYALANAAAQLGAKVTLISGPVNINGLLPEISLITVETTEQMYIAVMSNLTDKDIFIGAAAVADYRSTTVQEHKIKKDDSFISIKLEKNPDIIASVGSLNEKPFIVGFAAETDDLEVYALRKLATKNLDMIAANWVGKSEGGFESDFNALHVFWQNGQQQFPMQDKYQLAKQLMNLIAERFNARSKA